MNKYLLGVDGGASKTNCLIADTNGTILAKSSGDCSNKNITNWSAAILQVRLTVTNALVNANVVPEDIVAAYYGLGGVSDAEEQNKWLENLKDLSPNGLITIENDVFLPIYALGQAEGIAVVSGSGGNIGAIYQGASFHVNGRVRFGSSRLGQAILNNVLMGELNGTLPQALFDLMEISQEEFTRLAFLEGNKLAQKISPFTAPLYQQGHEEVKEIVQNWLNQVKEDIESFQKEHNLAKLPICLGGSTFQSLQAAIKNYLQFPNLSVASISLEEGAIRAAARFLRKQR